MRWWRVALMTLVAIALVAIGFLRSAPKPAPTPVKAPLRMDRITLEKTPCFGPCYVYTVTVERDGRATFRATRPLWDGGQRTWRSSIQWHAQVPEASMRALVAAVESPEYAQLRPDYSVMVTDNPSTILTVEGGGVERVTRVYVVPCRKDMPAFVDDDLMRDVEPVPDIFCSVRELVDVASCARYWAHYQRGSFGGASPNPHPPPPRCKPIP